LSGVPSGIKRVARARCTTIAGNHRSDVAKARLLALLVQLRSSEGIEAVISSRHEHLAVIESGLRRRATVDLVGKEGTSTPFRCPIG
jgi:hypothetical protein